MMKPTRNNTIKEQTDNQSTIDDDNDKDKKNEENETDDVRLMNDIMKKNELVTVISINHNMQHPLRSHLHAFKSDTKRRSLSRKL